MGDKRRDKYTRAVYDMYRDLYKHSTPSASFDELLKNATTITDHAGREIKHINYDSYTIDGRLYDAIVDRHIYRNKFKLDHNQLNSLRIEAYLGCGPSTTPKIFTEIETTHGHT